MTQKSKTVFKHTLFWMGLYLLWVVIFNRYSVSLSKTMTVEFCYLIFITANYYVISNFVVPKFLIKKKYALFILVILLLVLVSAWLRSLVAMEMNLHFFHSTLLPELSSLYINSILNISIWTFLIIIGKMTLDRIQNQQALELLQEAKTKSELDYLKAQINPHALFNSLNTIYGYIDKQNHKARNVLLQFSELLRYQLYDCSSEKVPLSKEIDYIQNYITFQQLRKNENLIVNLDISTIQGNLTIAPLLLIVLIENAFKFVSTSSEKENKIHISLSIKENALNANIFNTTDRQPPISENGSNGIGIANLKRRLLLLYPDKHQLNTRSEKDFYETQLIIDLA